MERDIETLHTPQQNRRNKLRFTSETSQDPLNPLSSHQNPINITHFQSPSSSTSQSMQPHHHHHQTLFRHNQYCNDPDPSCLLQGGLCLSLSMQQEHHQNAGVSVSGERPKQIMRSFGPLGPFTGYAFVLKQSRFLKPAQQILDAFCGVDVGVSLLSRFEGFDEDPIVLRGRVDKRRWKDSTLVSMLDEVYRRYKRCCQQIQLVVSSFEAVSGLGNASPYTALAFKTIMKHFTCLKNTILDRLNLTADTSSSRNNLVKRYDPQIDRSNYQTGHSSYDHNRTFLQHPVWRSQRGLPDHAVTLLRTWLFQNFLHPYPTDSEKQTLALQTGLSRTQVSNWFINARVRLWKPMVEEIHTLKERRDQASSHPTNKDLASIKQTEKAKRSRSDHQTSGDKHEPNEKSQCEAVGPSFWSNVGIRERNKTVALEPLARHQENDLESAALRRSFLSDISETFED